MSEVLFLCTGNLCRSPSAALFLEQRVRLSGPDDLTVRSAGTLGASNGPPERLLKEAAAFGLVFDGHVPRRMDVEDIRKSDVVVGMARQHVREAVLLDKESFSRAFTLRELVRRGQEIGPWSTTEPLSEWLHKVHAGRRHIDLIGDSDLDDIADPMGGSLEDYRRMLSEVDTLVNALYTLIWAN